jgi:hypothetical protein
VIRNVGCIDRVIRYILGFVLVVVGFFLQGAVQWISWGVGAAALLTAQLRFCTPYALLGISTCPNKNKKA